MTHPVVELKHLLDGLTRWQLEILAKVVNVDFGVLRRYFDELFKHLFGVVVRQS